MIPLPSVLFATLPSPPPPHTPPANYHKVISRGFIKHELDQITPIFRTFYQLLYQSKENQRPPIAYQDLYVFPPAPLPLFLKLLLQFPSPHLPHPCSLLLWHIPGSLLSQGFLSSVPSCQLVFPYVSLSSALCSNVTSSLNNKIYTVDLDF